MAATLADFKKGRGRLPDGAQGCRLDKVGALDQTKSPKEIADRETALGEALRAARKDARQGDILTLQIGKVLRGIIRKEFARRSRLALENREDAQDELPAFTPTVNQVYPTTYPLATFPPALLKELPELPKPIEYRLVRQNLILRDSEARSDCGCPAERRAAHERVTEVGTLDATAQTSARPRGRRRGLRRRRNRAQDLQLPLKPNSIRFLVMGDTGTGDSEQMRRRRKSSSGARSFRSPSPSCSATTYGSERPQDFVKKFERPYQALLDDKVEFNAALGNHDDQNQIYYKPFNLDGEAVSHVQKGDARFFVLDSNYLDPEQLKWLEKELEGAGSDWKIAYISTIRCTSATRGPVIELRAALEAAVREVQRRRRLQWARALVRTHLPAEGDLLFHGRRLGEAPRRR
jgi:hypothetical protein